MNGENGPDISGTEKKKGVIGTVLLFLILGGLIVGAYAHGIRYYGGRFLPQTYIDGVDVGELTAEEARNRLAESFDEGTITVEGRNGASELLDLKNAQIRRAYSGIEEALANQNNRLWIRERIPEKHIDAGFSFSYDEAGLAAAAEKLAMLDDASVSAPVNAYISADHENGTYSIIPEEEGNTLDREAYYSALVRAVEKGRKVLDLEAEDCYVTPLVRSDDERLLEKLELLAGLEEGAISLDLGAYTRDVLHADAILRWLGGDAFIESCRKYQSLAEELAETAAEAAAAGSTDKEAGSDSEASGSGEGAADGVNGKTAGELARSLLPEPDERSLSDYVRHLAETYDTYEEGAGKDFTTHSGDVIHIDADYGWQLDTQGTAEALRARMTELGCAVMTGNKEALAKDGGQDTNSVRAVWTRAAASHRGNDYGEYYAEVDLGNQKVYLMDHGECRLESNCVSGKMTKERMTPAGIYAIRYKQMHRVLTGYKPDGTVDYRSPVTYWMPFNNGIGFHDATWRGAFGGQIYVYSGSHGCVNMPFSKAKEMYSLVYKGMPVIVYY